MLILWTGLALASANPEYDLCLAAGRGDLPAVQRLIGAGADVNAVGEIRLDAPVSAEGMFLRVLGSIVTGGLLIPFFVEMDRPQYAQYHALSCALGAPTPRREVVSALLAAGADPERPEPGAALSAYLTTHAAAPEASDWVAWLRARGATPGGALTSLLVEDRPAGAALPPLIDSLLADGATPPVCEAARAGDVAMLARVTSAPAAVLCRDGEDPVTPLNLAAGAGRVEAVRWLVAAGVAPDTVLPAEPTGRKGLFKKKQTWGRPALVDAIDGGHEPAMRALLEAGADTLREDTGGRDALYHAQWRPQLLPTLLDATPWGAAMTWALDFSDPYHPESEAIVAGWLPPELGPLLADAERAAAVRALERSWWAASGGPEDLSEVIATLSEAPGSRAPALRLSANPCLPQAGQPRDAVREAFGKPIARERDADPLLPPPGTTRNLFGRAPAARPAMRVFYEDRRVARVELYDAAPLRAAGCDAPALDAIGRPDWQLAWLYGPHDDEGWRYGITPNGAWAAAWRLDRGVALLAELP